MDNNLWGKQTDLSLKNFKIGNKMPIALIHAIAEIKRACAYANFSAGKLSKQKCDAIVCAADKIIAGEFDDQFPLVVYQTGSGTQTNMNVNEVVCGIAALQGVTLHPNDDVNMSQSTNDVFPSSIHLAAVLALRRSLFPSIDKAVATFKNMESKFRNVMKTGRTHLQDATPIAFSDELSGMRGLLENSSQQLFDAEKYLRSLAIGGTAVGTGINAPEKFGDNVAEILSQRSAVSFTSSDNKFAALSGKDALCFLAGALSTLAATFIKIGNDVRFLSCGPRTGIGEISIPANEPGSSIMPGKVNPTQCEALIMVGCRIIGNGVTAQTAASGGQLELNACMPVIAESVLESISLASQALDSFEKNCLLGIEPNEEKMKFNLENSLMLATALSKLIGYDEAAKLVKLASEQNKKLKDVVMASGKVSEADYDEAIADAINYKREK